MAIVTDEQMTTYKRADGGEICGEFSFVNDLDGWFDDIDQPMELTKEVWVRKSSETHWVLPTPYSECEIEDEEACENDAESWWRSADDVWMRVCTEHKEKLDG